MPCLCTRLACACTSALIQLPLQNGTQQISQHLACVFGHGTTPAPSGRPWLQDNDIILCDGECNRAYHFLCVDPPVDPSALGEDEDATWYCPACAAKVGSCNFARFC